MPVELLQFGGLLAVIVVVALLWYIFVYKARRTGEGDGTPRTHDRERASEEDSADQEDAGDRPG